MSRDGFGDFGTPGRLTIHSTGLRSQGPQSLLISGGSATPCSLCWPGCSVGRSPFGFMRNARGRMPDYLPTSERPTSTPPSEQAIVRSPLRRSGARVICVLPDRAQVSKKQQASAVTMRADLAFNGQTILNR
jgi:hypothetical protein